MHVLQWKRLEYRYIRSRWAFKSRVLVYMFVVSEDNSAWSGPFYSAPDALPYSLECNLDRTRLLKYYLARHSFTRVRIAEPLWRNILDTRTHELHLPGHMHATLSSFCRSFIANPNVIGTNGQLVFRYRVDMNKIWKRHFTWQKLRVWNNLEKLNPLAFKTEMDVQSALYVANNNTNNKQICKYINQLVFTGDKKRSLLLFVPLLITYIL